MTATLYYSPGSASMLVHWLLIETGEPHRLQLVDTAAQAQKSADYLALNPNGVVQPAGQFGPRVR
jgi:glutathione S-transferase